MALQTDTTLFNQLTSSFILWQPKKEHVTYMKVLEPLQLVGAYSQTDMMIKLYDYQMKLQHSVCLKDIFKQIEKIKDSDLQLAAMETV